MFSQILHKNGYMVDSVETWAGNYKINCKKNAMI
jgi:hypothetical protein